jgi:mRNA interferase RelE/StbE
VKIRRTESFLKDYQRLPEDIRGLVKKQLSHLLEDPRHPSLRLKKLKGRDKYEIRITRGYRLTLRFLEDIIELRRGGTHDLLKREGRP